MDRQHTGNSVDPNGRQAPVYRYTGLNPSTLGNRLLPPPFAPAVRFPASTAGNGRGHRHRYVNPGQEPFSDCTHTDGGHSHDAALPSFGHGATGSCLRQCAYGHRGHGWINDRRPDSLPASHAWPTDGTDGDLWKCVDGTAPEVGTGSVRNSTDHEQRITA
ncbi:uncharacterized protein LOC129602458 isoform X4 [Paramacrobiotus metropolitanus]|uniref:uncharacterized protein LOC129602458 isoform X4 n=1 Tax=Paramacrobiotus metropolitanus TaxID=2943436 RepID=UPI00244574F1|nr:uncharacterized protein LOC129602458 isoform X4 [Paramacrobiotus metropolitanus]